MLPLSHLAVRPGPKGLTGPLWCIRCVSSLFGVYEPRLRVYTSLRPSYTPIVFLYFWCIRKGPVLLGYHIHQTFSGIHQTASARALGDSLTDFRVVLAASLGPSHWPLSAGGGLQHQRLRGVPGEAPGSGAGLGHPARELPQARRVLLLLSPEADASYGRGEGPEVDGQPGDSRFAGALRPGRGVRLGGPAVPQRALEKRISGLLRTMASPSRPYGGAAPLGLEFLVALSCQP